MDTRAVPLTEFTTDKTEVFGMNGKPSDHCGYSLPIVKHKPSGLYCVLSLSRKPGPVWNSEKEIQEISDLDE